MINLLFRNNSATLQFDNSQTDITGVHSRNITGSLGKNRKLELTCRQIFVGIVDKINRSAESGNHSGKNFQSFAVFEIFAQFCFCLVFGGKNLGLCQQMCGQSHGYLIKAFVNFDVFQKFHRFRNFHRISRGCAQNLIHVGKYGFGRSSGFVGHINN